MPQEKLDSEDAKTANAYIHRTVNEVKKILSPLEPDIRLIVLARLNRDTAEEIGEIEQAVAENRRFKKAMGG